MFRTLVVFVKFVSLAFTLALLIDSPAMEDLLLFKCFLHSNLEFEKYYLNILYLSNNPPSLYLSLQMSDTVSILSLLYILIILPIIPLYRTLDTAKQGERGDRVEQGDEEEQKNLM